MSQLALIGADRFAPIVDLLDVDTCQRKWNVEPGEVFILAGVTDGHVLVCGDSTRGELAEFVVYAAAGPRRIMVDDPPYGMGHRNAAGDRRSDTGKALRDRRKDLVLDGGDGFDPSFLPVWKVTAKPEAVYLFSQWSVSARWRLAMQINGWEPCMRIIWDKMHYGMGNSESYGDQTEDVFVWLAPGVMPSWPKREGNIWTEARGVCLEGGMVGHPTPKPFGLYRRPIQHVSSPGDVIIDPHAGSGPALIVADGLRRRAAVVDNSPRYCALMLERAERYGIHVTSRSKESTCSSL